MDQILSAFAILCVIGLSCFVLLFFVLCMLHKIYLKLDLLNRTLFPIDQG